MKQVIVRAYGARLVGGKAAENQATGIFLSQNRLWNNLVEIELASRLAYQAALATSDETLGELTLRHQAEEAIMESLLAARSKSRAQVRTKKTDTSQVHASGIKDCSNRLKDIRAQMKACKARAKIAAKPLLETIELNRRAKVKEAAAAAGLWWCHSETVLARYDIARVKAMKTGATLRFHRYDGEGSLGVRFTGDGGSMEKIRAGSTEQLKFSRPDASVLGMAKEVKADGGRRVLVSIRAGAKNENGVIPKLMFLVTMHAGRDLPENVPLKTVTLRRDMHVGKSEWKIVFTFSSEIAALPEVELPVQACGIDFGWRLVSAENGSRNLRVAAISWGVDHAVEYVTLDEDWLRRMERADSLRSELDESANRFASLLIPMINDETMLAQGVSEDEWFFKLAGKARRAKRAYPSLLMDLCRAHAQLEKPLAQLSEVMVPWYQLAYRLALVAHHSRRKAVAHRKHLFRNVAARLVARAGMIGIENADFQNMAVLKKEDGSENPLPLAARKNRVWASPSELRLAIEQAAKRERCEVSIVPAAHTTTTCSACGHNNAGPIEDLIFVCGGCEKLWDQDENSAHNCRKFALEIDDSLMAAIG